MSPSEQRVEAAVRFVGIVVIGSIAGVAMIAALLATIDFVLR